MVCTLVSRVLGIVKARVISTSFGGGGVTDAINFAYNIPNSLRKLLAEGAASQAFIPAFSKEKDDNESSSRLLSLLINFQLLLFLLLIILSFIFATPVTALLSDFPDSSQTALAASLLPYFTIFLCFISLSALFAAVLQARGRFLAFGASPIVFTVAVILSVTLLSDHIGAYAMAVGTIAGAICQALVCLISMRQFHLRYIPTFDFSYPLFRKVISAWIPSMGTALVAVLSSQLTYYVASSLPAGSVTAFSNAIIFYQAPYGIFFASISSVYFKELSSTEGEEKGRVLNTALGYLYTLLLPSAIILITLSKEVVSALLQSGAFSYEYSLLTASVLKYYLIAMIFAAFYAMLQKSLYASGRYKLVFNVSIVTTLLDFLLMLLCIRIGMGAEAVAAAYICSSLAGFIILAFYEKDFIVSSFLRECFRLTLCNLPLILCCILCWRLLPEYSALGSVWKNILVTLSKGAVLCLVVLVQYLVMKVPFLSALKRRR